MEKMIGNRKLTSEDNHDSSQKRVLPRVLKRRKRVREKLLEIASQRFALEGPENVRLEDIADEADISRATLYSHFNSKEEIIYEIIKPILETLIHRYSDLLGKLNRLSSDEILEELAEIYIYLWDNYKLGLLLAQRVLFQKFQRLEPDYGKMLKLKMEILSKLENEKKLRFPKESVFEIMLHTLVPLLRFIVPLENGRKLFKNTLRGLLFQ